MRNDDQWRIVRRGDLALAVRSFGGSGEPLVLLHGLAGHAGEWTSVAAHLTESHRVFALDLRGHGRSERRPSDVSPAAFCADVVAVLEALGIGPVHLVGQSFGGHIGFLVAATTPAVVSSLIVIEADPDPPAPAHVDRVRAWLDSWPVPFPSEEAAMAFFAPSSSPETWVAGLEARDGGYWPRFDASVLIAALDGIARRSWWHDWMRITAPTLVIRGDRGELAASTAERMAAALEHADTFTATAAGHDVHLDQPKSLAEAVRGFAARRQTHD